MGDLSVLTALGQKQSVESGPKQGISFSSRSSSVRCVEIFNQIAFSPDHGNLSFDAIIGRRRGGGLERARMGTRGGEGAARGGRRQQRQGRRGVCVCFFFCEEKRGFGRRRREIGLVDCVTRKQKLG